MRIVVRKGMRKPCRFQEGDEVSLFLWNVTEPDNKQLPKTGTVMKVQPAGCASGYILTVRIGVNGAATLCSNWFRPVSFPRRIKRTIKP